MRPGVAVPDTTTPRVSQCAETTRNARGASSRSPHASTARLHAVPPRAFMGLPWATNAALGITRSLVLADVHLGVGVELQLLQAVAFAHVERALRARLGLVVLQQVLHRPGHVE